MRKGMLLKRIALVGNIFILCLIVWSALNVAKSFRGGNKADSQMLGGGSLEVSKGRMQEQANKKFADYHAIIGRDIFRTSLLGSEGSEKVDEQIDITNLQLQLKGTAIGDHQNACAVILDKESNREGYYYLNDLVQDARIIQIRSDRIILLRDGKKEALVMIYESGKEKRSNRYPKRRIGHNTDN